MGDVAGRRRTLLLGLLWIVGLLFVVMGALASWRVVALRELAIEQERTRLQIQMEDAVAQWEDALLADLQTRLEAAAADPERVATMQRNWRRQPWFDSVFVWRPPAPLREGSTLFPLMSVPDETEQLQRSPCLNQFIALNVSGESTTDQLVEALLIGCRRESENVRLTASSHAALLLRGEGRTEEALLVLEAARLPDTLTLRAAALQGISPFRLVGWHTLRIQLLQATRPDLAAALAMRVGEQLSDLEAPDLAAMSLHTRELLSTLRRSGYELQAKALEQRLQRADRRKHAYEEVQRRLIVEAVDPASPPPPRFVYDVYSDQPFLLYYGWSDGLGVGIALEQAPLLSDFLHNRIRGLHDATTLVEARSSSFVAGARSGGRCAIEVPFATLTHLRVCVRQSAVDDAIASSHEQTLFPILITVVALSIGLAALLIASRAIRHEYELIDRQRAFSTRVTHELKTPLAGIRVMAENLELGAYRDEDHRREMAHRIVVEADQLKRRVDEVLAVAKQRTIPSPAPFDPEEILYLAIEEWGPRFGDSGADLMADLAPTDPVLGDGDALKDAVVCLLDNALKYRREDRTLSVKLELVQIGRTVQISVTDNGLGVPKSMRKKIFDRFVRVEGPGRGKAGGHGLGLHQVREIVAAHRGTVSCGDGIDGGAQFVIKLPAKPEKANKPRGGEPPR